MPQNGQTQSKNLAANAASFLKCVWPFWNIMHERVKKIRLFEWITWKEFIIGVSHNKKGNLGYGDCSKYLAYSIESQVVGFRVQASLVESSFRWAAGLLGKVSGGAHSKQI